MSELTDGDIESAFTVALQNNAGVTSLLPGGAAGVGCGVVTTDTAYPYILIRHLKTTPSRVMQYGEGYSESVVYVTAYAVDVPGTPAKGVVSALHKAIGDCLNQEGSLTIPGRDIDRPVHTATGASRDQTISETQVIFWSDATWSLFSSPIH